MAAQSGCFASLANMDSSVVAEGGQVGKHDA